VRNTTALAEAHTHGLTIIEGVSVPASTAPIDRFKMRPLRLDQLFVGPVDQRRLGVKRLHQPREC